MIPDRLAYTSSTGRTNATRLLYNPVGNDKERPMTSSTMLRASVWHSLLETDRCSRYYNELASRYRRRNLALRFSLMLAAMIGGAKPLGVLPFLPDYVVQVSSFAIIGVIIWDFLADYSKKSALCHAIAVECSRCCQELDRLWSAVEQQTLPDSEIREQLDAIDRRRIDTTARAGDADVLEDKAINKAAEEESDAVMLRRYATSAGRHE